MTSTLQTVSDNKDKDTNATRLRDIERLYVEVRRDIMAAAPFQFVHDTDMSQLFCNDGLGIAMRNVPSVQFNRWVGMGVEHTATEHAVDRALDWMTTHANRTWGLEITPAALPADLVTWIEARGLRAAPGGFATFWRDAIPVEHTRENQFTICLARVEDADLFGAIAVSGFGMPDNFRSWMSSFTGRPRWYTYIAYHDTTPVGVAAMFVEYDMAWFGIDSTLPAFQRKGVQSMLLSRRIRDAAQCGVKLLTVETDLPRVGDSPNASYRNIRRAGFIPSHARLHYVKSPETENLEPGANPEALP